MDLFDKVKRYTLADEYRAKGIYPYFHALESRQDVDIGIETCTAASFCNASTIHLTTL